MVLVKHLVQTRFAKWLYKLYQCVGNMGSLNKDFEPLPRVRAMAAQFRPIDAF